MFSKPEEQALKESIRYTLKNIKSANDKKMVPSHKQEPVDKWQRSLETAMVKLEKQEWSY